jgi:hypothetical protein
MGSLDDDRINEGGTRRLRVANLPGPGFAPNRPPRRTVRKHSYLFMLSDENLTV